MPYDSQPPMFPVVPQPTTIPIEDMSEYQEVLARTKLERDTWESKFHALQDEKMELLEQIKAKDALLLQKEELLSQHVQKKQKREDLFSSGVLPSSDSWKGVADKLVVEKAQMKSYYEMEIQKLKRKFQDREGPSSDALP